MCCLISLESGVPSVKIDFCTDLAKLNDALYAYMDTLDF